MADEQAIQNKIRIAFGARPDLKLFRNNTGAYKDKNGQFIRFGLCVGSSDLIGLRSVVVTPDMVGKRVALFAALEIKTEKGRPTADQTRFLHVVSEMGGLAGIARNEGDAAAILGVT
jgi:hypothetical protein